MKVVILCGGLGTRLSEETSVKPKPMVKIGSKPILQHIIKLYSKYGYKEFILALGYKGYYIKNYFQNKNKKDIKIKLVNTGKNTLTGGRLLRLKNFLKKMKTLCLLMGTEFQIKISQN